MLLPLPDWLAILIVGGSLAALAALLETRRGEQDE